MKSIRKQLTAGLLAGLLLLIAAGGLGLHAVLRARLIAQYDAGLLAQARALATLTEDDGEIEFEYAGEMLPEFGRPGAPEYFEFWHVDGRVLERSVSLGTRDLPRRAGTFDAPLFWDLTLPDGRAGRAVGVAFSPPRDDEGTTAGEAAAERRVTLVLARGRRELQSVLHLIALGLAGAGLLLPLGIVLIVVLAVGRGLRPLRSIGAQTARIDATSLALRFPESGMPAELQPICRSLNALLQRLEEAFARERRFTGDAAHALRTPIAELRTLTEVAAMYPDDEDLGRRAVAESLAIALQMERLVTVLLALARGQAAADAVAREPLDLAAQLQRSWARFRDRAADRRMAVAWEVAPVPAVEADAALLLSVLDELFLNAVLHAPAGGALTVQTAQHNGAVRLRIANTNPALAPDDLPHLFEPFWQKDLSRTDAARSGLGLALAAALCRLMAIHIAAHLSEPNQFAVELTFSSARSGIAC